MTTIHLDGAMVPASLRGAYTGKMFEAIVCESMTIPMDAGLWSGGSRDVFKVVRLADGAEVPAVNHNAAPWDAQHDVPVTLVPGVAVVRHTMFCGKDLGLTFYVHPDNAAKLLPAPVELTAFEAIVLRATSHYKSSYAGRDRYDMAKGDSRDGSPYPTREEWNTAKARLIVAGLLNKAGAITPAGRNAVPSRY